MACLLAWAGRYFVNPDGISYLDLSDDFAAGRWSNAVSGHWSPAYPLLLSVWLKLFGSGSQWEALGVHVLNVLTFIAAMAAFELFLRELRRSQQPRHDRTVRPWALDLAASSAVVCAWSIFLWCTLVLVTIKAVTPDMMVAAIAFALAALVIRIREEDAGTGSFAAFGALLGLGYLTKSFMFAAAIALLGLSYLTTRRLHQSAKRHLISGIVFIAIALPQVIALSRQAGTLRISDSARIVYALRVNHVPKLWLGSPSASGTPVHPIEQLSTRPQTLAFPTDKPNRAYPLWDEPSYWYEGMHPRFDAAQQLDALRRNIVTDLGIALKVLAPLFLIWLMRDRKFPVRYRTLTIASTMVLLGYAILNSEGRLIAPWLVIGIVSALAGMSLEPNGPRQRIARGTVHVMTAICVISLVTYVFDQAFSEHPDQGLNARNIQWEVAKAVNDRGVPPGSRIALVGDESDIHWARLAGVQAAIHIPRAAAADYWRMPAEARADFEKRIAAKGARAMIASWTAPSAPLPGWTRIPGTQYSFLPLN